MNGEHQYSSFFRIFALYISAESPRVGKDMCIIYGEDVYKRLAFGFQNFAPFDLSKEQMATGNVLVVCNLRTVPSFRGKDMPYTYRRGLSALLVLDRWACEGLGTRNGQR